ncbi:DJ-1/PfpI family protein [Chitinophagaceae bacterium 26-R-25]|nr:DJ-1/PfpI family protein [Chitinophagaceae bacterium 26-R-25]
MRRIKIAVSITAAVSCVLVFIHGCKPLHEFYAFPEYKGADTFRHRMPSFDTTRKIIFIVSDNKGTEIFDMLAPYNLFSLTGKVVPYIIAKERSPITVYKGLFILPQLTFAEADSLRLHPSVIIVPALSGMSKKDQDATVVQWLQKQYSDSTIFLSVCQGSLTMAAAGIYDGKQMTTHASEFESNRKQFEKPQWIKDVAFTVDRNLYSTAGVSNAVVGSLAVISKLFGRSTMLRVADEINYRDTLLKTEHDSKAIKTGTKMKIAGKIFFRDNKKVGVLLQNNINELQLAAILDTYNRTFPERIRSYTDNNQAVQSAFGLTFIPTGNINSDKMDELHVPGDTTGLSTITFHANKQPAIITYPQSNREYIINTCLQRIATQYGSGFESVVKMLLDYN